jgi:FkbM family methyltransferase
MRQAELARARQFCASLAQEISNPVFVKVGANDGTTGDPFSDILLADVRWKGLLIEPVPYCFDRLRTAFRDEKRFSLEQAAIGATAGEATFYYVDEKAAANLPDLPNWYDQLGSFDKGHILKHLNGALAPFIIECTVKVFPLKDVLEKHGIAEVHVLHIDTEGHDYEVLKTVDFASCAPLAIFIEHKHLPELQTFSKLTRRPIFVPSVGNYRQGMLVSVPLHLDTLPGKPTARDLEAVLAKRYAGAKLVKVVPAGDAAAKDKRLEPEALNGTDVLELRVYASERYAQAILVARLDNLGKGASGAAVQSMGLMLGVAT